MASGESAGHRRVCLGKFDDTGREDFPHAEDRTLLTTCLIVAISAGGCGGGGSSSAGTTSGASTAAPSSQTTTLSGRASPAATVSDAADPREQLRFTKSSLTAKAGKVTIHFTNHSSLPHNFTLQPNAGGAVVGATPTFSGGTKTLKVSLKPGTYTFFCSVPGHRQVGMQGTLTVR